MSGIQPSTLSDDEFLLHVNAMIDKTGLLPQEVINELVYRAKNDGRDKEHEQNKKNPAQLPLPFNE